MSNNKNNNNKHKTEPEREDFQSKGETDRSAGGVTVVEVAMLSHYCLVEKRKRA